MPPNHSEISSRNHIKLYDVIVIGSGSGMLVVEKASEAGLHVALICKGPAGGTCLNMGCMPSKMLIAAADQVMEINAAHKFGIKAEIKDIDFHKIMKDMLTAVKPDHERIYENLKTDRRLDFYSGTGQFVDDHTIEVNDIRIRGKLIFIAAGARPNIPLLEGEGLMGCLTNESLLELNCLPASMAIIGGGFIASEYSHFFSAMGTKVTMFQKNKRLIPNEEPEISALLMESLSKRMTIHTHTTVTKIENNEFGKSVTAVDETTGRQTTVDVEQVLIAAGRTPNADILEVEKTGVETDDRGFVKVDDYLKTRKDGIFAFGDVIGRKMFTHVAYKEAELAWHNSQNERQHSLDYLSCPRAIFSFPQIASVGLTEEEAKKDHDVLVGKAKFSDVAKGVAIREDLGFAKAVVDKETNKILGFHIIGPNAAILIQEVVNAMAADGNIRRITDSMHIHPAMSEIIIKTFSNLSRV